MPKKFSYVSIGEAHEIIVKAVRAEARREAVPIQEAYNRVLAEDVMSGVDIPPFDVSHFDGYAVRAEDTSQASVDNPVFLRVASPVERFAGKIGPGEAAYILTGFRLATGADAVIPVEMAKLKGDVIEIRRSVQPYEHVTPAGRDVKRGETVFKAGHVLRAQDVELLIELKKWEVKTFAKPLIAIVAVGSELTDRVEETGLKRFNSHGLMISALVNEAGGVPLDLGIVPDDVDAIKRALKRGLKEADVVTTIGGCSVGEKDYVWEAAGSLTPSVTTRGVKVQPGRVTSMGVVDGKAIVMLPGHVQSTLVGFYVLLLPLIRLMSGLPPAVPHPTLKAVMSRELVVKEFASFERVRFVRVAKAAGDYVAEPVLGDSSLISVVARANSFIIIPKGKTIVERGENVSVHLLPGLFPPSQVGEMRDY